MPGWTLRTVAAVKSSRSLALLALLGACTTQAPVTRSEAPEVVPDISGCQIANARSVEALSSEPLRRCEFDLDCGVVSPLISRSCGFFANIDAFEANRVIFDAQSSACEAFVQVVPLCPAQRGACVDGRCEGVVIAELPDECAERRLALKTAAGRENTCAGDDACTWFDGDFPGTKAFAKKHRADLDRAHRAFDVDRDRLEAQRHELEHARTHLGAEHLREQLRRVRRRAHVDGPVEVVVAGLPLHADARRLGRFVGAGLFPQLDAERPGGHQRRDSPGGAPGRGVVRHAPREPRHVVVAVGVPAHFDGEWAAHQAEGLLVRHPAQRAELGCEGGEGHGAKARTAHDQP